jgi:hypothetical protein
VFLDRNDVTASDSHPQTIAGVVLTTVVAVVTAGDSVLAGMIAAGLSVDAIALYLDISPAALFNRAESLGLTRPHDRPMRRAGGKNSWTPEDSRQLIALWMAGVRVRSIAALGRSMSAIYGRRRRLGLPPRDRRALHDRSIDECLATPPLQTRPAAGEADHWPDIRPAPPNSAPVDQSAPVARRPASTCARAEPLKHPSPPLCPVDLLAPFDDELNVESLEPGFVSADFGVICDNDRQSAVAADPHDVLAFARPVADRPEIVARERTFEELSPGSQPEVIKTRKVTRISKVNLTEVQKLQIEERALGGQRTRGIANDLGVTFGQASSHLRKSAAVALRNECGVVAVDDYDAAIFEANKRRFHLVRLPITVNGRGMGFFWTQRRSGVRFPAWVKTTSAYKNRPVE